MAHRKAHSGKAGTTKLSTIMACDTDNSDDDLARTLGHIKPSIDKMPVTTRRTAKGAVAASKPTATRAKRSALTDVTNLDGVDDDDDNKRPKKRVKATSKHTKAPAPRKAPTSRSNNVVPAPSFVQEDSIVDTTETADITPTDHSVEEPRSIREPAPVVHVPISRPASRPRSVSRHLEPRIAAAGYRRGMSASSDRGTTDPAVRRKLGELTGKYEMLELKYNALKEVAQSDAQSNFDKLKLATQRKATDHEALVTSLRQELAVQQSQAAETKRLRAQLDAKRAEYDMLAAENKKLASASAAAEAHVLAANQETKAAHAEVKSMQMKLAAMRTQLEKAPSNGQASATNGMLGSSKLDGPALANLRVELYCDMTGLIIHSIKKTEEETIYDCSQTGVDNRTLRFELSIENPSPETPGPVSYQDRHMTYTPIFDEKNDQTLMEILPDFLVEEIEFPGGHVMKWYTKLRQSMMTRVVLEE